MKQLFTAFLLLTTIMANAQLSGHWVNRIPLQVVGKDTAQIWQFDEPAPCVVLTAASKTGSIYRLTDTSIEVPVWVVGMAYTSISQDSVTYYHRNKVVHRHTIHRSYAVHRGYESSFSVNHNGSSFFSRLESQGTNGLHDTTPVFTGSSCPASHTSPLQYKYYPRCYWRSNDASA